MSVKKILFIVVITIIFCSAGLFYAGKTVVKLYNTPQIIENVPDIKSLPDISKELMPATATHISYCHRPFLCTTYEYNVSEKDFLAWAQIQKIPMVPIKDPASIFRYYYLFIYSNTDDPNKQAEYESLRIAIVKKGYEYHSVLGNGGGNHIVYDTDAQKAYHDYPHH